MKYPLNNLKQYLSESILFFSSILFLDCKTCHFWVYRSSSSRNIGAHGPNYEIVRDSDILKTDSDSDDKFENREEYDDDSTGNPTWRVCDPTAKQILTPQRLRLSYVAGDCVGNEEDLSSEAIAKNGRKLLSSFGHR